MKRGTISGICWALALSFCAALAAADDKERCASSAERAQDLRARGELLAARKLLILCSAARCPKVVRRDCARWFPEVQRSIPTLTLRAQDSRGVDLVSVRITIDGRPVPHAMYGKALEVDPGPHRVRFEADGFKPASRAVVGGEGEKSRLVVVRLSPNAERPSNGSSTEDGGPILAYVLGGLGLAALASFGYFEITAQQDYRDMKDSCGRTHSCPEDDVDALRTRFTIAGVSLGAGVLLLGTSALLFATSDPAPADSGRTSPSIWGGGFGLSQQLRF